MNLKLSALLLFLVLAVSQKIIHLPLDQRFTTRVAFLNLATLTPFTIATQPQPLLPTLKRYPYARLVADWFLRNSLTQNQAIISMEMLLYGGLIASRISNNTFEEVVQQLDMLEMAKQSNPELKIYGSAVVMRIPASDGDFEQPYYWANYGRVIYFYSFYADKYTKTGDMSDLQKSQNFKKQIPTNVLNQFLSRRDRNQRVLKQVLNRLSNSLKRGKSLFQKLYITLDDNAEYGFNIAEANQLKQLVANLNLTNSVLIYPGADEVHLSLLSKLTSDYYRTNGTITLIYRNRSTTNLIPKYEGQSLQITVNNQIKAAGGMVYPVSTINLLVNNFNGPSQKQSPNQSDDESTPYSLFDQYICDKTKVIGFVDNKYANGADIAFVQYLIAKSKQCAKNITEWAYAGWNTNGNTLGTVISNAIILSILKRNTYSPVAALDRTDNKYCDQCSPCSIGDYRCANSYFNILRILEDRDWQAILRQKLKSYIEEVPTDSFNHLDRDLIFYERYAWKSLWGKAQALCSIYELSINIESIYYPWNRTFEIGIKGNIMGSNSFEGNAGYV